MEISNLSNRETGRGLGTKWILNSKTKETTNRRVEQNVRNLVMSLYLLFIRFWVFGGTRIASYYILITRLAVAASHLERYL